jgi:hypothetical protein
MMVKDIAIFALTSDLSICKNVLHGVGRDAIWVSFTILLGIPLLIRLDKAHAIMAGKNLFHLKLPRSILFISLRNRHE